MGERDGYIRLPRFRIETQADLSAPLKAMGMSQVFDPARAALGASATASALLMAAMQQDFVEVNERHGSSDICSYGNSPRDRVSPS